MKDKITLALELVNAVADMGDQHINLASNGKGVYLNLVVSPAAPDDYKYVVGNVHDATVSPFTDMEEAVKSYVDAAY